MDELERWLRTCGFVCYEILDDKSKRRAKQEFTDIEDTIKAFNNDYEFIGNGKYSVKGYKKPNGERGAALFPFQKGEFNEVITQTNSAMAGGLTLNEMLQQARDDERKKIFYENLEKEVKELKEWKEKMSIDFKKVVKALIVLNDDIDENDFDAFKLIGEVGKGLESTKTAINAFKGFSLK